MAFLRCLLDICSLFLNHSFSEHEKSAIFVLFCVFWKMREKSINLSLVLKALCLC
jgi:hypothetical protein